jgi:phosphohistidine swiveling domain-containing protein
MKSVKTNFYELIHIMEENSQKGQKASVLGQLLRLGFPVVDGYVIVGNKNGKTDNLSKTQSNNNSIIDQFLLKVQEKIPFPWIMRSSSTTEDLSGVSFAGCYESSQAIHNLKDAKNFIIGAGELPQAVLKYGEKMGVQPKLPSTLIQKYIQTKSQGVYFYPSPWGDCKGVLEYGSPSAITSGSETERNEDFYPGKRVERELQTRAEAILKIFKWKMVDMEWGVSKNGDLYIFQARPINKTRNNEIPQVLKSGEWVNDLAHNPVPLSVLHEDLVLEIYKSGFKDLYSWNSYIYYRKTELKLARKNSAQLENLSIKVRDASSLEDSLKSFVDFTKFYISTQTTSSKGKDGNLISGVLGAIFKKHGKPKTPQEIEKITGLLSKQIGVLPISWDIASKTVGDDHSSIKRFVQGQIPKESSETVPENELDDLFFAKALNELRRKVLLKGEFLKKRKEIDSIDDVFFLKFSEILTPNHDVKDKVIARKLLKNKTQGFIPPIKIKNGELIYETVSGTGILKGNSLVKGKIKGKVHLLRTPLKQNTLSIFVAKSLTPQDILLLMDASGLILESPSRLSHGVIIAMELGIPTIVGVKGATTILKENQFIELHTDKESIILLD